MHRVGNASKNCSAELRVLSSSIDIASILAEVFTFEQSFSVKLHIITIMVILMCYFSGEHIAHSYVLFLRRAHSSSYVLFVRRAHSSFLCAICPEST